MKSVAKSTDDRAAVSLFLAGLFLDSLTSDEVLLRSEALSDTRLKDVLLRTAGQDYAIAAELLLDQSVVQVRNLTLTSPSRRQQELADDVIVFVDAAFLADDILDSSLLVSLLNVSERGLRLNETTIDSRMELCSAEVRRPDVISKCGQLWRT